MIKLTLRLDESGVLRECRGFGHAESGPPGADLVCASVSILLRSCARTLEGMAGVTLRGGARQLGELGFQVEDYPRHSRRWMIGVGDFLITGLSDLAWEYPEACELEII